MAEKKDSTKVDETLNKKFRKYTLIFWGLFIMPFICIALLVLIAGTRDLPATEELTNPKTNLATEIFTSDLEVIGRYYQENRSDIQRKNIPDHLVDALLSTEDVRYRSHAGIDFIGLGRAVGKLGKSGGGSTISQQLAKLLFTDRYEGISFGKEHFKNPKNGSWLRGSNVNTPKTRSLFCI